MYGFGLQKANVFATLSMAVRVFRWLLRSHRLCWINRCWSGWGLQKDRLLCRLGMSFRIKTTHSHREPVMAKITLSAVSVKASRRRRNKTVYRVRNWAAYDAGLKQRGSRTMWLSPQAIKAWYYQGPTRRGSSYTYSALAIQTALMMRLLYPLPLRPNIHTRIDRTIPVDDALALSLALAPNRGLFPFHFGIDGRGFRRAGSHHVVETPRRLKSGFTGSTAPCADAPRGRCHWAESLWRRRVETHLGRYKRLIGRTLRRDGRITNTPRHDSAVRCSITSWRSPNRWPIPTKKCLNPRGRGRI